MKRTSLVFGATILLLAIFSLAQADHRVIAGSWCGMPALVVIILSGTIFV